MAETFFRVLPDSLYAWVHRLNQGGLGGPSTPTSSQFALVFAMSATSASVLSGPPGTDPYSSPMALKVEPDVVGGAGGPPRIGSRHEVTSSPVNVSSEEEQRQQQQLRDCLESHVSDPAKTSIARMVEEVETMTDMERLLLFMRLPNARPGIETS